jgi:hypothetical protein
MRHVLFLLGLLALPACGGGDVAAPRASADQTVTLYCYETLADPACYLLPDRGRGNRLLGVADVPLTREIALIGGEVLTRAP